jgi:hypothetical protein
MSDEANAHPPSSAFRRRVAVAGQVGATSSPVDSFRMFLSYFGFASSVEFRISALFARLFYVLAKHYILLLFLSLPLFADAASKVTFDSSGNAVVNGKPFFPIGVFSYSPDTAALEDMRKHCFNTIVAATENHRPEHMDLIFSYGLRIICPVRDPWLEPASKHPGMLAWYLADEPEGHGQTSESLREKYSQLKKRDPDHPIGLDHFLLDSLAQYTNCADFTMTSYYPLLAGGGPPLENSAVYLERSRALHGRNWPHWPFIQIFGGTNTDGGKWKQPEPGEARCLVYIALVHRAQGIFYFSYWPQAPKTWAAVGVLNQEIQQLTPWLLAEGNEISASSTNPAVHIRAKQLNHSSAGMLLAVNTTGVVAPTEVSIPGRDTLELRNPFDQSPKPSRLGKIQGTLGPYETWAYVWGRNPKQP